MSVEIHVTCIVFSFDFNSHVIISSFFLQLDLFFVSESKLNVDF